MPFIYIEYIASVIKKTKPINNVVALKELFNRLEHLKTKIHIKELDLLQSIMEKRIKNSELFPLVDKWISNARRDILVIIKNNKESKLQNEQDKKIRLKNERKRILNAAVEATKFLMENKKNQRNVEERSNIEKHKEEYIRKRLKEGGTHIYDPNRPGHNENEDDILHRK